MPHRPRSPRAGRCCQPASRPRPAGFLQTCATPPARVIRHPAWLDVLTAAAGRRFDELAGGRKAGGAGADRAGAGPKRIIDRADQSRPAAAGFCGRELASLHRRMRRILADGGPELGDESPLGTATVCRALRALKEAEHLSPDEALQPVRQLDLPLRRHLADFYRDLDHALAAGGCAPSAGSAWRLRRRCPPTGGPTPWRPAPACDRSVDALRLAVLGPPRVVAGAVRQPRSGARLGALLEAHRGRETGERHRFGTGVLVSLGASELGALLSPQQAAAVEVVERCALLPRTPSLPAAVRGLFTGCACRCCVWRCAASSATVAGTSSGPAAGRLHRRRRPHCRLIARSICRCAAVWRRWCLTRPAAAAGAQRFRNGAGGAGSPAGNPPARR